MQAEALSVNYKDLSRCFIVTLYSVLSRSGAVRVCVWGGGRGAVMGGRVRCVCVNDMKKLYNIHIVVQL
jgi:hypothetical protein